METISASETTTYFLTERLRSEEATLVFGTSRTNQIASPILGETALNLHYVYGNPNVVGDFLSRLDSSQWQNVRRIVFLVDFHTLEPGEFTRDVDRFFAPSKLSDWMVSMLESMRPARIGRALASLWSNVAGAPSLYVTGDGAIFSKHQPEWNGVVPRALEQEERSKWTFELARHLGRIEKIAEQHGVPVLFVTPLVSDGYARIIDPILDQFTEAVAGSVREFYLFVAVPGIPTRAGILSMNPI